ncbi:methyltransferase family protein, partial [Stutzerimonas nitrititolerans]|uniref:methyltransferase family protein n=1 Tax=Stutzerimonas nitrititolerans TaxID=2482751 RepID=UPI0035E45FBE
CHAALRGLARECHCLRPAPCLALFDAATRLATKGQQTLVIHVMQRAVIRHEERLLVQLFGEAYRSYCARVRRWL